MVLISVLASCDAETGAVGAAVISVGSAIANGVSMSDGDPRSLSAGGFNRNAVIEISKFTNFYFISYFFSCKFFIMREGWEF